MAAAALVRKEDIIGLDASSTALAIRSSASFSVLPMDMNPRRLAW